MDGAINPQNHNFKHGKRSDSIHDKISYTDGNSLKAINSQISEPNIPLYNTCNCMSTYSTVTLPQPATDRQSVRKIEFPFKISPNYFKTSDTGL